MQVTNITEEMLDESVDLLIDTFSRAPWNDVYDSKERVRRFFLNHFANNYFLGFVALVDGQIIGLSLGMQKPWTRGMEYYIDEFCIGHAFQGRGFGSAFLREIEISIQKAGLNGIILITDKNFPAYEFYAKHLFKSSHREVMMTKILAKKNNGSLGMLRHWALFIRNIVAYCGYNF